MEAGGRWANRKNMGDVCNNVNNKNKYTKTKWAFPDQVAQLVRVLSPYAKVVGLISSQDT